jgi:glycine cleavage system H protein
MNPQDCRYTKEHEWVRVEDDTATVGITAYAQGELGDVVFVELPEVGRKLIQGQAFGVVESVKAASDLYAPLSGEVVAVNEALADSPDLVNKEPFAAGWMLKIKPSDRAELTKLLDASGYEAHLSSLH